MTFLFFLTVATICIHFLIVVSARCYTKELDNLNVNTSGKEVYENWEVLKVRCKEKFEHTGLNIRCFNGRWRVPSSPCKPASCKYPPPAVHRAEASVSSGPHGTNVEYFCFLPYEVVVTGTPITCSYGQWIGNLPHCKDTSCRHPPPAIEGAEARVSSGEHGTKVDYNCIPPYELEVTGNQITCSHGDWIGKSPRCKDTRCHTKHLPYYHGIKAENKTVYDKEFYTPLCLDGYSNLDLKLQCNKGVWKNLEQNPEFCKPDYCVVPGVANGDFYTYKERQISIGYNVLIEEKVDTGYVVKHNSTLYLICQKGTLFQGRNKTTGTGIKIICNSKQWVPKPDCWYSTSPTTTASITTAAPTTTARPTGNHLNSSKPLSSDEKYESVPNNNGNYINTRNSVKDCVYENSIPYLSVFFGGHIINAGIVSSGFEIKFACQPVGMLRLHGPASVTCASGKWVPTNFPTCVLPTGEGEVALMFDSDMGYHVLPGYAVTVAKHTTVNIICYEVNRQKWPNLHHSDRNKNISAKKIISQEGLLYTIITIENMTEVYTGNYTCSSEIDSYTISVFVTGSNISGSCGPLPNIEHAYIKRDETTAGSEMIYTCQRGYFLNGTSNVICQENGLWSIQDMKCLEITCSIPPTIPNGYSEGTSLGFASEFEYKCNSGYTLVGNNKLRCEENGSWSNIPPVCEKIHCSTETMPNGYLKHTPRWFHTEVKFECNIGYKLVGRKTLVCLKNGDWTGIPPFCEEIHCSNPPTISNGYVKDTSLQFSSEIEYICNNGYRLVGNSKLRCVDDENWSGFPPICEEIQCSNLSTISNGYSKGSSLRISSEIEFVCNSGYKLVGNNKLRCEHSGNWSGVPPICEEIYCPIPPKIKNGYVKHSSLKFNAEVEYVCNVSYKLVGSSKLRCQNNGNWSDNPPICKEIQCSAPPTISNGHIKGTSQRFSSEIEYICSSGYKLVGNSKLRCEDSGSWSGFPPICQEIRCSPPPAIPNGFVNDISLQFPFEIKYVCNIGFKLVGSSQLRCQDNGNWIGIPPICEEIYCSNPPTISNGYAKVTSLRYGTEIEYICNSGYRLVGNSKQRCEDNGIWIGISPICEAIHCSPPPAITNGYVNDTSLQSTSEIEYKCNVGFKLVGISKLRCQDDGNWSDILPICKEIVCSVPPKVSNGFAKSTSLKFASETEYICNSGYRLVGNSKLRCEGDGNWSGNPPVCKVMRCSPLPVIANGYMKNSLRSAPEIEYKCNTGYKLVGSSKLRCEDDGKWSGNPPICKEVICPTLPKILNGYVRDVPLRFTYEVEYLCVSGYTLVGNGKLRCQDNGKWSDSPPVCEDSSTCYALRKPRNSSLIIKGTKYKYTLGDSLTFSCPENQELTFDLELIVCLSTGWSDKRMPTCIPS